MALGAGRKGLASELVDEFGYLTGEMPTGEYYTKSQTDNKFETKTHAGNTYQKKTLELPLETLMGSKLTVEDSLDALNEIQKTRQPKTLEVPIEMLSGTKLTVESALQGLNEEKANSDDVYSKTQTDKKIYDHVFSGNVIAGATGSSVSIKLPATGANAQTFVGILWIDRVQYTLEVNYNGSAMHSNYDNTKGTLSYDRTTYELNLSNVTGAGMVMAVIGLHI